MASVGPACRAICVEPRCPAPLTWDEQLKLFKRRVVLAINRVGTTFGRFLALEVLLCDGCTLLGAPDLAHAELEAAWVAGGHLLLDLATRLRCKTPPDRRYR